MGVATATPQYVLVLLFYCFNVFICKRSVIKWCVKLLSIVTPILKIIFNNNNGN